LISSIVPNCSNVVLPERLPTAIGTVSSAFAAESNILMQHRVMRMLHSMLTSRIVLHIRAQDNPICQ